ncbi:patatin family protein [Paenibacillus provencensis]|uniref:Patatin family protein n=1 Tax=Paenibacillus provencensis TaxID=441151 RepID=A0ABW3PQM7_9BACL|nr:patatin family protein [Paenibacillus sp. MER 78]MCM3127055.1 patatin family protein [Paenibacillus sp. MER 78]
MNPAENDIGLILEGGGMRGLYTAGVLDCLRAWGIDFPIVVSSSSSALIGSYYISKQRGKIYEVFNQLLDGRSLVSIKRMLTHQELFHMDLIFNILPAQLAPFDFHSFSESDALFLITTTDMATGSALYHDHYDSAENLFTLIRASSSLPVLSPSVLFQGRQLIDGGVADPIPIQPSIDRGYKRHLVVLTRNKGYIKKPEPYGWMYYGLFRQFPQLQQQLKKRHNDYNQTTKRLLSMERDNEVFIIQPEQPLIAGRTERNKQVLMQLYWQGYRETEQKKDALFRFLFKSQNKNRLNA